MPSVIIRIGLRYLAGALVAAGWIPAALGGELATDPELIEVLTTAAGFAIIVFTEAWYWLAKKIGGAT